MGGILEQGQQQSRPPTRAYGAIALADADGLKAWTPPPRAAAASVLATLAFGVIMGNVVRAPVSGLVRPALVAVIPSSRPVSAPAAAPADGASAGGGSAAASSGSTGSPSTSPAPQPANSLPATSGGTLSPAGGGGGSTPAGLNGLPPIKHVFLIMLSNQGYTQTFGSSDPFLAKTLPRQGELVQNYYGVTAGQLANEIALVSGQGPTPKTALNCPQFVNVAPAQKGSMGQVLGDGCVYPPQTTTLADELAPPKKGGWKAYVEDIDHGPAGSAKSCRHAAVGAADGNQAPTATDHYVTWRNPFVYFHSLLNKRACAKHDVGLDQLAPDLKRAADTPALSYIAPSACNDGDPQPCLPGAPAGLTAADKFLQSIVPKLEASPAYKADGLIAITFDQAPQTGLHADASACCDPQTFPNLPPPQAPPPNTGGATNPTGGGGQVGLLLISRYVKKGSINAIDYFNHFSLLRTIEDLFGVKRLGYASDVVLPEFDASVFNQPNG